MNKEKILDIKNLKKLIQNLKQKKRKIVLCHGVFDLVHAGHILYFNNSKSQGDVLIVSITADKFVNKGPNRPVFSLNERMESVAQIASVNYVIESNADTAIQLIKIIKPDIYSKGVEYKKESNDVTRNIIKEKNEVKKNGGKIFFSNQNVFSSSKIINSYGLNLSENQRNFVIKIKKKLNKEKILKQLDSLKKLNILIIGETMVDEYIFCETLGKSGKDSYLALRKLYKKKFVGGTLAIAKNLASFCGKVTVITYLGEKKEELDFFKKNLERNINFKFLSKKKSPTIIKTRFVDDINSNKLMGVQVLNDKLIDTSQENQLKNIFNKEIKKNHLVIVSDYGHGLITDKIAKLIMNKSKFLAVNAQLNAANIGFHTISKYKKSNLSIINENELRHAMRDKESALNLLVSGLLKKLHINNLAVTMGDEGMRIKSSKLNKICHCPAFTLHARDKVGAGDTLLALLSLCIYQNIDLDFSMFIASLAAAENVKNIANSEPINKKKILKILETYLK